MSVKYANWQLLWGSLVYTEECRCSSSGQLASLDYRRFLYVVVLLPTNNKLLWRKYLVLIKRVLVYARCSHSITTIQEVIVKLLFVFKFNLTIESIFSRYGVKTDVVKKCVHIKTVVCTYLCIICVPFMCITFIYFSVQGLLSTLSLYPYNDLRSRGTGEKIRYHRIDNHFYF